MKLNAICHNCFEFVFPGYWHFENGVRKVSEDVLLDHVRLPHVLVLTVHLVNLLGWMGKGDHSLYPTTLLLKVRVV